MPFRFERGTRSAIQRLPHWLPCRFGPPPVAPSPIGAGGLGAAAGAWLGPWTGRPRGGSRLESVSVLTSVRYGIDKALELFKRGPTRRLPHAEHAPPGLRTLERSRVAMDGDVERDLQACAASRAGLVRLDERWRPLVHATSQGRCGRGPGNLSAGKAKSGPRRVGRHTGRGAVGPRTQIALAVELATPPHSHTM